MAQVRSFRPEDYWSRAGAIIGYSRDGAGGSLNAALVFTAD